MDTSQGAELICPLATLMEVDMTLVLNPISTHPRTVVRWERAKRIDHENITPEPFGPERAKEIVEKTQAYAVGVHWIDCIHKFMTLGEDAYVSAVWDAIPDGRYCWYDAFSLIRRGEV
jgi:hypothetical protein